MRFVKHTLFFLALTLFFSCQEIEDPKKPEITLTKAQMEEILYESILLKAARGYNTGLMIQTGINPETYIFDKFKIDSVTLAQNMAYYATKTDAFKAMNTRVLDRFDAEYKIKDSLYQIERKERDSLNKLNQKLRKETLLDTSRPVIFKGPILDVSKSLKKKRVKELKLKRDSV
ncbi:DUF4296 domain-containing protein [Dokdonia sp. Hel_I_53]|uniref:DUF4296 domain-containing protein n=1 Tax=Dokdonia sp. Hel_I_53 TaxID=1566287 RepID=UPI00119BEAD2|nr:DUF4296 domain-containing protein [Dokdonia sp. Hel_I_53]TVZ52925.1 uncharacterized protein DUF4296 [Dokdonia sp. Hel_I_53]